MDELYEALRVAEAEGRKDDVARLAAYIEEQSAKQEPPQQDVREEVPKAIGAGAGAVLGPLTAGGVQSGINQIKAGRVQPLPSLSVPHPTELAPGASAVDEAIGKGTSNAFTQHTREAQLSQRQKGVAQTLQQLKAQGVPVNPNLLAEMPTQYAMPGSGIHINVDTARQLEQERAAGKALPKNATMAQKFASKISPNLGQDVANFAKGVSEYKLPFGVKAGPLLGRMLGGAATGMQGIDAYNRAQQGDTTGSVISGIGAAGTGVSTLPVPLPAKAIGAGVGLSAEAINAYRDALRKGQIVHGAPENYENVDPMGNAYATGGLVHLADGGMPNVNLSAQSMPDMTGQPGVGYMQMPQSAMLRMQLEQELANKARLRAGATGMGMAIPGQQGVKMMPGNIEAGVNIPVGQGNVDISGYRSINPVNMPAQRGGHMHGANVRYTLPFAEGGDVKKPEANEGGAFIGYPQINKNRKIGSGTGFLDALVGAPPSRTNVLNPSDYSYMEGYEKGEPYGIASMALPFVGAAAKPLAKEVATRAFMGESLTPKMMRGLMPEQPVAAATAYHGTPYQFNKFDLAEVGTGEGHQAFGHGIYFAENPNIAKEYQKNLAGYAYNPQDLVEYWKPGSIRKSYGGHDKVIAYDPAKNNVTVQSVVKDSAGEWVPDRLYGKPRIHSTHPDPKEFKNAVGRDLPFAGSLYKVDIPDEHIPKMLNWDNPISQHSPEMQDLLRTIAREEKLPVNYQQAALHENRTGEDFYNILSNALDSPQKASEILNSYGVPGIKYLDSLSRKNVPTIRQVTENGQTVYQVNPGWNAPNQTKTFTTKEEAQAHADSFGTRNFVTFDPDKVKILERNNEPIGPLSNLE